MRCFHLVVPVDAAGDFTPAVAGIWDSESGSWVQFHYNPHETNNVLDYYFAVSDNQNAFASSAMEWASVWANDEFGGWAYDSSRATAEEVDWGYCDGSVMDGRLNASDLGALAYVYPTTDGYSVWELNLGDMKGYEQFAVSAADIAAASATANETGVNQQIGVTTERGTTLWALAGGQCQMNHFEQDGKINEFAFDCA